MLALLRKEAREALVGLVLLTALLSWLAIRTGADIVVPSRQWYLNLVAAFAVLIGVSHGFGEFAIEERNTWRYLVHRSTGYRGAFFAKLAVDWAVLALLTLIPLGVHAAWIIWFTNDAEIALWSRYFEVITAAAIGVGAHAIGVFAAQLRRTTWLRFSIAIAGSILFLIASLFVTVAPYGATLGPAARYLLWIAAISLPLYAISYRMFVAGSDDDRAFSGKLGIGVATCAIALLAPSVAFIISAVESMQLRWIVDSQPTIWRANGKLFCVPHDEIVPDEYMPGVSKRFPTLVFARNTLASTINFKATPSHPSPSEPFAFGAAWRQISQRLREGDEPTRGDVWLPRGGGRVAIVQYRTGTPVRRLLMLGKGPQDTEFSSLAIWMEGRNTICIVDPQDRSLWRLIPDAPEPAFERVALPDNDAFVRVDRWLFSSPRDALGSPTAMFDNAWVVVGEHGMYEWSDDSFVVSLRSTHWLKASDSAAQRGEIRVDITRSDALEPTVLVRDTETGAILEHAYTNRFDVATAVAYACSLARPTIGSVASLFRDVPEDCREIDSVLDPLLTGGRRIWLLALNVALSIALATSAWRRGTAGDPRRIFDTLAILLLGVPAAVVLWLVEPRSRAVRKVVVATAPREQLLISSV